IDNDCDGFIDPQTFSGTIEMPASGTVDGHSSGALGNPWQSARRTAIRLQLTQSCEDPEIAIFQHGSADSSIAGSYYIMDAGGSVLDFTPFETHNCPHGGSGDWCTPQRFNGLTLDANNIYWLAFQNGEGQGDMSGPSIYTDSSARTVSVATFDQPREDNPGNDTRGLPTTTTNWQNRWRLVCD
ncbi:MAG TPA: hypothetical protein DIU15_14290, partial [Deltaproteobacteria bacterium]|nr:hypothetical protein [Deltaproteobacteria bacterium]